MSSQADHWAHDHVFLGAGHERNERRTWFVVGLTLVMMAGEIVAGSLFGSMALLADGWHMGTHAAALGIAGLAYLFARRHARNPSFTFGTGKFGELAAFSSALILLIIAIQVAYESGVRLLNPEPIAYGEAIAVAVLGLLVNLVSAWLLADSHQHHHHGRHHGDDHHDDHGERDHHHGHHHHHDHGHGHHDNNLRAAYLHVLADAATSLLAIGALLIGMVLGWSWADAAVGLVGSAVIASWAYGLIRDAGAVLLDANADRRLEATIRARLEAGGDRVTDLHLWQVGPGHRAVVVSIVSHAPLAPAMYKQRLRDLHGLSHVTVEVEHGLHA
ncbi:CDF family Co(II)/Ni(II) efflux transporter DmeF [Bradyrhizobium aeschynomenes]|uniref:CDF family Co(II)/Ni(II) efflux transporter DmeF n=1 Tax=Bradyrhizobium aeschynomenes TaxID=2734909 RepID=UPI001552F334|nr:CDF family Co(II)/Ni(II) efflux transporter DmeF [Bradyrhizobium aeschynomenes]NPV22558.1 CDF family Co(II)/Ni(II) efflux transporter DmeF [Bradyrhizobium aeschynomenes]